VIRLTTCALFISTVASVSLSHAQGTRKVTVNGREITIRVERRIDPMGVAVSHLTGRIRVGANPENTSELFQLIDRPGVAEDLQLDAQQMHAWQEFKKVDATMRNADEDVFDADAYRLARAQGVEEILRPQQLQRLRQIAYRIEVSSIGLAAALAEGRLGEVLDVTQSQSDIIWRRGQRLEQQRDRMIRNVKIQSEAEVRALLDPEQSKLLVATIGEYYRLPVLAFQTGNRLLLGSPLDPADALYQLQLMSSDEEIQGELSLTQSQRDAVRNWFAQRRFVPQLAGPAPTNSQGRTEAEEYLREHLDKNQVERVKQLAYRQEVSATDLSQALARGRLGKVIAIREDQLEPLLQKGSTVRAREQAEILKIQQEYEDQLLENLFPSQRKKCLETLGPIFIDTNTRGMRRQWLKHSKFAKPASIEP
jgi:hypothetical protein